MIAAIHMPPTPGRGLVALRAVQTLPGHDPDFRIVMDDTLPLVRAEGEADLFVPWLRLALHRGRQSAVGGSAVCFLARAATPTALLGTFSSAHTISGILHTRSSVLVPILTAWLSDFMAGHHHTQESA